MRRCDCTPEEMRNGSLSARWISRTVIDSIRGSGVGDGGDGRAAAAGGGGGGPAAGGGIAAAASATGAPAAPPRPAGGEGRRQRRASSPGSLEAIPATAGRVAPERRHPVTARQIPLEGPARAEAPGESPLRLLLLELLDARRDLDAHPLRRRQRRPAGLAGLAYLAGRHPVARRGIQHALRGPRCVTAGSGAGPRGGGGRP